MIRDARKGPETKRASMASHYQETSSPVPWADVAEDGPAKEVQARIDPQCAFITLP